MIFGKPFIYFSEAIITPTRSVDLIRSTLKNLGASANVDVNTLWKHAALSVRSQAAFHRLPGFKGERHNKWLMSALDSVADGIQFPTPTSKLQFKTKLLTQIGKPSNYYVPEVVRSFMEQLDANNISYGVIANDSHLYPAILKSLNVSLTGPLLLASGPDMFKPMPKLLMRAIERAPAASKNNIWFIGSSEAPCDNIGANSRIRGVLVKPDLDHADPVSQHFRVPNLQAVLPYLVESKKKIDMSFLDTPENSDPEENNDDDDVVVTHYTPQAPPLDGQEQSAAAAFKKQS